MASINKFTLVARNFSSTAAAGQMVKAPLQLFGSEGRYATALYSAATKMKQLDQVEKDLTALQTTMRAEVNLRDLVISPIINRKVMSTALKDTSKQLHMAEATTNLLTTMADYGRLRKLDGVISAFRSIMAAHRGEVVCSVVTAKPLDGAQRKQLEGALKKFVKANESIQLTAKVDPELIGGMIVFIGDKYIDMSIASKVKLYTDVMSQAA